MALPFKHKTRRTLRSLGWGTILLTLCSGITTPQHYHKQDPQQGWLELRPILMFTLSSKNLPASNDDLNTAMTDGLRSSMTLADKSVPITLMGDNLSQLDSLSIDVSHSRPDLSHKPVKLDDHIPPKDGIFVQQFEVLAQPLMLGEANVLYHLRATDAKFSLYQDAKGRPALIMVDASQGSLEIDAPIKDLQSFITQTSKLIADKYGFLIHTVNFGLESQSPHSINISIRVGFAVGVVNIKGRMDIDDDMNATASGLHCVGQGPVGIMVAQMLEPSLKEYEGRTRPLVEFPQRQIKLHDIKIKIDSALHITANFGKPADAIPEKS